MSSVEFDTYYRFARVLLVNCWITHLHHRYCVT